MTNISLSIEIKIELYWMRVNACEGGGYLFLRKFYGFNRIKIKKRLLKCLHNSFILFSYNKNKL